MIGISIVNCLVTKVRFRKGEDMTDVVEGWYPDPDGKPCERYWDGQIWTEKTRPFPREQTPSFSDKNETNGKLSDDEIRAKVEAQRQKDLESIRESWKELKITIPLSLLVILGLYLFFKFAGNSSPSDEESIAKPTPVETVTENNDQTSTNNVTSNTDPLSKDEVAALSNGRQGLYNYVETWSGYVAGNESFAAVANSCQGLSAYYNSIRSVSSDDSKYEDLIDRAKDYTYETFRSCEEAVEKQDLNELGKSASLAATGIAFFDQLTK